MTEKSKFAGALGKLSKAASAATVEETNGKRGKRSDPDWIVTTVYLKKHTKRKTSRLLEDLEMGKDVSDLIEELLQAWISKHSKA